MIQRFYIGEKIIIINDRSPFCNDIGEIIDFYPKYLAMQTTKKNLPYNENDDAFLIRLNESCTAIFRRSELKPLLNDMEGEEIQENL